MWKLKHTFFFPQQHMLEKLISLYSYILHPTSESWHLERWFFSCDCVCCTLHIFLASRNSLHCLLLSLYRRYCASLNVAHFWFFSAKLHQVFKSLWILTTGQALMQKNAGTFTFLPSKQQWKAERLDRSTFSIDAHMQVCLKFLWILDKYSSLLCNVLLPSHVFRFSCRVMRNSTKRMVWNSCFARALKLVIMPFDNIFMYR